MNTNNFTDKSKRLIIKFAADLSIWLIVYGGGTRGITVVVLEKGSNDPSSNPV